MGASRSKDRASQSTSEKEKKKRKKKNIYVDNGMKEVTKAFQKTCI
jgi:hypothetical protein